jgi:CRISPR-associated exonuclease Cas4
MRQSEQSHTSRVTSWTAGSRASDLIEEYNNITDIKQYAYCPRVVYFERVMHARAIMGSQQEQGREEHFHLEAKEKKRKAALWASSEFDTAEKVFRLELSSEKLRLRGILDLLLKVRNELVPVEYKNMRCDKGRAWSHHKYQLTGYALLLEDSYGKSVLRGLLEYVPEELALLVPITPEMKKFTVEILKRIDHIVERQYLPPVTVPISKCFGCEYFWVCQRK